MRARGVLPAILAVAGAIAAGIAMSFGQTYAPSGIAPLFNSALPVVTLAAAVSLAGRRWWSATALGAAAGPLAMVGYYSTAVLRGYGASPSMVALWCVAGVAFGSAMGLAAWVLRGGPTTGWKAGAAAGYWPGIAAGEAAHGLTRIADTTPVGYWWAQLGLATAVLAILTGRRLGGARTRLIAAGTALTVAAAVYVAYGIA